MSILSTTSERKSSLQLLKCAEPTTTVSTTISPPEPEVISGYTIPQGMPDVTDQIVEENAANSFPIPPDALIRMTRGVLALNNGCDDESVLAENFKFVAPVVGPLDKATFVKALKSFKLTDGFPVFNGRYFHFRIDPFQPNRVWFTAQSTGKHTGDMGPIKATNKTVESSPQALSMIFNEEGKVEKLTVGYIMDREIGNQGGLGGIFGIFYAIGFPLPFPEARPWRKSWQMRLFNSGNKFAQAMLFIGYAIYDATVGKLLKALLP